MNTYVVGDLQGCFDEFTNLLDLVEFDESEDHLWLAGDLINRGPDNLGVLEFVMSMKNIVIVLGNHDLHFLAIARGKAQPRSDDTLDDLLQSRRLPDYIAFLREKPLLHLDPASNTLMVHAGLPPQLSLDTCLSLAKEVETTLKSHAFDEFLAAMYGDEPAAWDRGLSGMPRMRVITNYFTRLRYCTAEGEMELTHKADIPPPGFAPWFSFPRQDDTHILFGHWAALEGVAGAPFVTALDTGCVWGRELTAIRLEDRMRFSVPALNRG